MKRIATGTIGCLLLAIAVLCTGCPEGRSTVGGNSAADSLSGKVEVLRAGDLDSIICGEACTEYACYFKVGSRNKKALEHIRVVVFERSLCNVDFEDFADPERADQYRRHLLDSLRALEWLDGEPWISMRKLFLDWSQQQLERDYIVYRAHRDPAFLYDCSEADSVLVGCADILTGDMSRFVERVRCFWKAYERAKVAQDSTAFGKDYLRMILAQVDRALGESDSTYCARERLFQLFSNHINIKIHKRLGENGTVDFISYTDDFLAVFDSVRVDTWDP